MATDYYELLGVPRNADDKTIKAAFRKAAMDCHPDRHGGCSNKEAHFKALNEAYDCLKDPQKRAKRWGGRAVRRSRRRFRGIFGHLLVDLRRIHGPSRSAGQRR
jgi:DnaJ-class molecular chaperone